MRQTLIMLLFLCSTNLFAQVDTVSLMTPELMINKILEVGENVTQQGNVVNFTFKGFPLVLVFDVNADRMRLVSPITDVKNVDDAMLLTVLEANFHSALDARYAVSNDIIWSAFIHPLGDLSPALLESAITQVTVAHATFGGDFTSGALIFPGSGE